MLEDFDQAPDSGELLADVVMQVTADPALFLLADVEQRPLEPLLFGEVENDPGEQFPLGEIGLADRQVDGECRAVLVHRDDLASDPDDLPLAPTHIVRDITVVLSPVGRRHQHLHILTYHLLLAVAEHHLGRSVDEPDAPILAHDDDGVHRCLQDCAETLLALA